MPQKRALLAVVVIVLAGAFLIPAAPARAEYVCHEWSFAAGPNGWTPEYQTNWNGGGWRDSGSGYDSVYIYKQIPTYSAVRIEIDFTPSWSGTAPRIYIGTTYPVSTWHTTSNARGTSTVSVAVDIQNQNYLYIVADRWGGAAQYYGDIRLTAVRVYCASTAAPEYTSVPDAGGTVTVGSGPAGASITNANAMQISNVGTALLMNDLAISGENAAHFEMITDSPLGVAAGGTAAVVIACTPPSPGPIQATLTVTTNDTNRPTNTYTLTCTGDLVGGAGDYLGTCLSMGQAATFASGWNTFGGARNPPGTQSGMMMPPGSEATYPLSLQASWQYGVTVKFRATTPGADVLPFRLRLGQHPGFDIPIPNSSDQQTYEIPAANYRPDQAAGYTLRLSKSSLGADPGLIVDYICVNQAQIAGAHPGQGGGGLNPVCESCMFDPGVQGGGDLDIFSLIGHMIGHIPDWLFCSIRQLFECELMPAIQGIWQMATDTVSFLSSFRGLFDGIVTLVSDVTTGNLNALGGYVGGNFNNVGAAVGGAWYTSGMADAQNQIVGGINNVAPSVANALGGAGGGGAGFVADARASADPLDKPVGGIIEAFGYLFTMVPQFIGSMVDGINTSAYTPVSGSITCSAPGGLLYYPCLGFYVADNTLFQGPAQYLIPILMAVLAWDTLTWAIAKFKEAFSK